MAKQYDITGRKFGKWTVLSRANSPAGYEGKAFYFCRCECGFESVRKGSQLVWAEKKGINQSCANCARTRHGLNETPEYRIWLNMRYRCLNEKSKAFKHYGGRGIKICERWNDFSNFYADMGPRPSKRHSIDRIDNDGDYEPSNCQWRTSTQQARNQRNTVNLTFNGKTQCIMAWANELNISHAVIWHRINALGWSVDEALSNKVGKFNWRGTLHKDAIQYEANGEKHPLTIWSRLLNVPRATMATWLYQGYTFEQVYQKSIARTQTSCEPST